MTQQSVLSFMSIFVTLCSYALSIIGGIDFDDKLTDFVVDGFAHLILTINVFVDTLFIYLGMTNNKWFYNKLCGKIHKCCFKCLSRDVIPTGMQLTELHSNSNSKDALQAI